MTDRHHDRDPSLAELLNDSPVADHADDFWRQLDQLLDDAAEPAPAVFAVQVDPSTNGAGPRPSASATTAIDRPVDVGVFEGALSMRSRRRGSIVGAGLVAAAALVVVALLGLGVLGGADGPGVIVADPIGEIEADDGDRRNEDDGADDRLAEGPVDGPIDNPIDNVDSDGDGIADTYVPDLVNREPVDYRYPSPPRPIGPGSVVGFSPDGTNLLVLHDHPSGEPGSEGAALLTVWAYPTTGGEPELALPEELTIETGTSGSDFEIGTGGDIAWVEWCDGALCGLRSAVLAPDGAITGVVDLEWRAIDRRFEAQGATIGDPDVAIGDLALSADGTLYLVANGRLAAATRGYSSIDVDENTAAEAVAVIDDGNGERPLVWRDGVLASVDGPLTEQRDFFAYDLVASTGGLAAAIGVDGIAVVAIDGSSFELVPLGAGVDVAFSPDGQVVAIIAEQQLLFESVDGGGDLAGPFPVGTASGGAFSQDGTSFALTVLSDEGLPMATVIDFRQGESAGESNPNTATTAARPGD